MQARVDDEQQIRYEQIAREYRRLLTGHGVRIVSRSREPGLIDGEHRSPEQRERDSIARSRSCIL
jgi:hypothetical protein